MTAKRARVDEPDARRPAKAPRNPAHRSARPAGVERAHAIGIMSGTSADGMDAALTRIADEGGKHRSTLVSFASRPFDDAMRRAVLEAQEGTLPLRALFALSVDLAGVAIDVVREALSAPAAVGAEVEVIGFHGQTVFHDPRGERSGTRVTVQVGEASVLAAALGMPVVSNFRMADLVAGGEGAPLVPRFDWNQFTTREADRVILNLGGIANLTRLRPGAPLDALVAFDCGPANMLLDGIVEAVGPSGARFDAGGELAARGRADLTVVREFLADPFFDRPAPKSAGREEFGRAYRDRFLARTEGAAPEDRLRTAVGIVAASIVRGIGQSAPSGSAMPDEVIVSGGGAQNLTLRRAIEAALPGTRLTGSETHGIPEAAKEAMAFAFLAHETWHGRPGNVPSATGARQSVVLGTITPAPHAGASHGA
jgi:anhydro-N-acetylmuramic acid kinase